MAAKSDVGVLTVFLEAISTRFDQGIDAAQKKITGFKGTITGLGKTWTELNSKIGVVASALELAVGSVAVAVESFKGNWESAADAAKSLPIVGGILTQFEKAVIAISGVGEELAALEKETQKVAAETARAKKEWDAYWNTLTKSEAATSSLNDKIQILEAELAGGAEAGQRLADEIAREDAIRALEEQLDLAQKIEHEARRNNVTAAIEEQIAALMRVHDLTDQVAQAAERDAAAQKAAADATKARGNAAKAIEALEAKRAGMAGQGISGRATTYSSPMGTIRLPSMSTAVDLARKQLSELSAIDAQIQKLRDEVKALAA